MQISKLFINITKALVLLSVFFTLNGIAQDINYTPAGKVMSVKIEGNSAIIITDNAFVKISPYSASVIRVFISRQKQENDFSYAVTGIPIKVNVKWKDELQTLTLFTDSLKLMVNKDPFRISFYNLENELINADDKDQQTSWIGSEVTSYKKLFAGERFIGLGEKTGPLDRRGLGYTNWNTDCFGYSIDQDPMYVSIPFYMGIHDGLCYGIFLDNTSKTHFNFGASNNTFSSFAAESGDMNYYFIYHSNVRGIINSYTWLTGKMPMPPKWSLGFQQSRWSYFPDDEVLSIANTFRAKQIPLDMIYLDIHYMDNYKVFTWDKSRFPDAKKMIAQLKLQGIQTALIFDPGIKIEKGYLPYEEGVEQKMFLQYPGNTLYEAGVWPGLCNFPDFTNAKCREWWGKNFKGCVDDGVAGFWNDMNEPASWGQKMPSNVEFNYDGKKTYSLESRNIYGMQMARATYEGTKKLLNGKRPFVLTRAGFAGIQRYSAIWTGDNVASDDHLLLGVRLVNSLGLSGVAQAGVDVGGFKDETTTSLFARWISVGAFTPFFRCHKMINMKSSEPWSFGEETEAIAKHYITLRYKLMPYLYSTFHQSTETGMPVSRSLCIDYTNESKIYERQFENEYMFGDAFLVAPFVSTVTIGKVYLPEGNWYNFYSDELFKGKSEIYTDAPLYRLPLFIKAGSILLMQSPVQSTADQPYDTLYLHVYTGQSNSFTWYEDDGLTYNYSRNQFYKREITYDAVNNKLELHAPVGEYNTRFTIIKLFFHGSNSQLNSVNINQQETPVLNNEMDFLYPDEVYKSPLYFAKRETCKVKVLTFKNSDGRILISW